MTTTASSSEGLQQVMARNRESVDLAAIMLCAALAAIILVLYILTRLNYFTGLDKSIGLYMMADELLLLAAVAIGALDKRHKTPIRLFIIAALMVTALIISTVLSFPYLMFALPIVLVTAYYDGRFTLAIAVIGAALMCIEPFFSSYIGITHMQYVDFMTYTDGSIIITSDSMTEAAREFARFTVPSLPIYAAMVGLSVWVTDRGLKLMKERSALAETQTSLENELSIAAGIQQGMLPEDFPDEESYAITATMVPAKDVGGDFYDFIKIGSSRVAFLVADVSGKGMPAALFMASARTLVRSNLKNGLQVDVVMDRTNAELIKSNKEKLFVTAWLGMLDLKTGALSYVNAGHNPPFLIRADGSVESVRSRPNFVLGRKKGLRYMEHRMQLSPGDRLLLYTDGLTDATNPEGEMFTVERVEERLRSGCVSVDSMMDEVRAFSGGADQFDDLTMLLVEYRKPKTIAYSEGEVFYADPAGHDAAIAYIRSRLEEAGCSEKVIRDMEVSSSEVISNINMYAYPEGGGTVRVSADVVERIATVIFRDTGPEYNPLERSNPDAEKRIREHKIGGFGIFIVKKLMDDVRYERTDGMNVLTIMKEMR